MARYPPPSFIFMLLYPAERLLIVILHSFYIIRYDTFTLGYGRRVSMCFCWCHSTRPNNKYNSDAHNEAEK